MEAEKLQTFADLLYKQKLERLNKQYPNFPEPEHYVRVTIRPGRKYTRVNVGDSGAYMVVNDTGEIFGIKGYGVIHRGHRYGTLDTIEQYYWGEYAARKVA